MVISSALSHYRWNSIPQALGFGLLLYVYMFGGRCFGILCENLFTQKCLPLMAIGSVVAAIISLIRFFYLDGAYRAVDLFTSWNGFGTILIFVGGLTITYLKWRGGKWTYLMIPYLILTITTLIATKSRGGWFGFLAMLISLTLFSRKTFIILLTTILLLSCIFLTFPPIQNRFLSSFSTEQNISRVFIWRSTLNMIKEHPIFGVGTGVFPLIYHQYVLPDAPEKQVSFAHNLFLQVFAEFGFMGFICFCGILFPVLYMSFRLAKTGNLIYQGVFSVLIGVLIHQQVDIPIWGFDIGGAFWMLVGLTIGLFECHEGERTVYKDPIG